MQGGGGGGGGFPRFGGGYSPHSLTPVESPEAAARDAELNDYLQDTLAGYNDRDAGLVRSRIEALQRAVEQDVEGVTSTQFGGSVSRHTYVDGLSDIDVLLAVNDSVLRDASPQEVLAYVRDRIAARLPTTQVTVGDLAVTITYSDGIEIQVLPALRTATGLRIARADGSGWSHVVRPDRFAQKLTEANQAASGRLVPTIKLFKGLLAALPSANQLRGYHVESLAIEAFRSYQGRLTHRDMLLHLVREASHRVHQPIVDATGQSRHVDDYLGGASSTDRVRVSNSLRRLAERLESGALDTWRPHFED